VFFGKIKLDRADTVYSEYIRIKKGRRCARCGKRGIGTKGIYGLDNSHFFSRKNESTRFYDDNCDPACTNCHAYWESHKTEYEAFKLKQLGQERFNLLVLKKNTYQKKDRKLSLLIAKELLKGVE